MCSYVGRKFEIKMLFASILVCIDISSAYTVKYVHIAWNCRCKMTLALFSVGKWVLWQTVKAKIKGRHARIQKVLSEGIQI